MRVLLTNQKNSKATIKYDKEESFHNVVRVGKLYANYLNIELLSQFYTQVQTSTFIFQTYNAIEMVVLSNIKHLYFKDVQLL